MKDLLRIHEVWDVVDSGSDDAKKTNIVKGFLFQSIPEDLVLQIGNLKTGKEMWEAIKTRNLGADHVKEARIQTLITKFENLKMLDNGSTDEYATKLSGIASKSATLGEVMSEHKLNLLYARTEYSNGNDDSSRRRGRGSYSRGRGRGRGQGRGQGNSQNLGQRDSSKNREDNKQKGKQHEKRDLSHIQCYRCDQYGHFISKCPKRNRNHEVNLDEAQEKGNYSYFSELNENIIGRVRFKDGSYVSIKGKGSILFQGKNEEQKLLKDVYYILALQSNVIILRQTTTFGYDISIQGDFLTMRDSWESLLIKFSHSANRLYKAQLKVGKEDTNVVGRESDEFRRFLQCVHEKAVYRKVPNGEFTIDVVNLDDLFVTGTSLDLINEFKRRMESHFKMSDLGELTYNLGIEVSQRKDRVEIKQERYAIKILKEAGMENCNATLYPMEKDLKLSKAEDEPEVEATQYRKVVGCLRYLLHTRPDLTYLVGVISRYMQSPRESHARAIKQIMRYVKGTTSFGIKYNRSNDIKLVGYSDSSHNVDIHDGRGTNGHVFYLGASPITWCSQKQTIVALSSCEAEFMAATTATCQAIWLRELLAEMTRLERQKVIIRVDNKSAIALSKNPIFHGKSKHIHTRYHFICECVENEQVIVEHVSGENQRANPLTNALARITFKNMRSLLGVQELPFSIQKFGG
nr:uncharacterized mitochondrial protein AtMg00810-like [Tanacetum cinerariifolium]